MILLGSNWENIIGVHHSDLGLKVLRMLYIKRLCDLGACGECLKCELLFFKIVHLRYKVNKYFLNK